MKAAYIEKFGGPEVLTYGDLPDPVAGPGQVVVDVVAASVNGADPKVAAGEYKQTKFPLILGRDFSGKVSAVGEGVTDLKVGDEVFGVLETGRDGTYCEKIAVGAAVVGKKPAGLSHVDAAAMALTGLTAICAVENSLQLKAGETILIQGGAGGVASLRHPARQASSARGSSPPASTGNLDYVRGLGADEVIDYNDDGLHQGREEAATRCSRPWAAMSPLRSFAVLKPGGRATFIASGPTAPKPDRSDVTALRPAVPRERKYIERIAELHGKGAVRPQHVTLFELAKAREALGVSAARHKGKPGGRAAFIASGAQAPKPDRGDVIALRPAVPRERRHMERIAELYGKGVVRAPHVTLFDLAKAAEALGVSAARHFKGKLVLKAR